MSPPFSSLRPKNGPLPAAPESFRAAPLELIADDEGSVSIGWVGAHVLYSQSVGGISADVGRSQAVRIKGFVDGVPALQFFVDASRVTHYDLLARSAFVRAILSSRRKFQGITLLTFATTSNPAEESLVNVLEPLDILRDPKDFKARLQSAAPFARQMIEGSLRVNVTGAR